jgi:hypothetical protein
VGTVGAAIADARLLLDEHHFLMVAAIVVHDAQQQAYGQYAEGPITDPKDLAPAFKRAIARVKAGEPALIDVVTQPR